MIFSQKMYRGESGRPSDPGDFGAGEYWSSHKGQAKAYAGPEGRIRCEQIRLKKPVLMLVQEAYDLAEEFGTITGDPDKPRIGSGPFEARARCSKKMREFLLSLGYDGMVVEHDRPGGWKTLEVVRYVT